MIQHFQQLVLGIREYLKSMRVPTSTEKQMCVCVYQLVVHSVKRQLTGSVDQVGEADEGFDLVHVQDQHGCRGGHTLHLGERHPERVRHRERERGGG